MSLILDALNRADRERKNSQPTPDINTVHEASYRPGNARLPKIWIVGGVLLIALVMLLVYLLLQARLESSAAIASAPVADKATPSIAHREETGSATAQTGTAPPISSAPQTAPSQPATMPSETNPSVEVHSLYADHAAPAVDDKINDLYKPVEEPPVVQSVPVQVPAVTSVSLLDTSSATSPPSPAANKTGKRYDDIQNVPDLRQLPWGVQQEIPSIIYAQHNFTGDASSNVVLNGQPRRAGNQVGGQLNLEEIYVDGVLLRFGEHRFKLRAMNNWVNM